MATSDLDQLIEMGFDKERAELAVARTGGRKDTPQSSPGMKY
ncbi:hypothetical protein GCM10025794_32990 [Massilia kyonggiensis]